MFGTGRKVRGQRASIPQLPQRLPTPLVLQMSLETLCAPTDFLSSRKYKTMCICPKVSAQDTSGISSGKT